MAHFAQLDENNLVIQVIVVDNKDIINPDTGQEDENLGISFCKNLFGGNWIQTSYNNKMRVRYAGIGYSYDSELDAFIPPKPFQSWLFNEQIVNWESPVGPCPELTKEQIEAGARYKWDEENGEWDLVTIN